MNWTDEKIGELKTLWTSGKTGSQIAAVFGTTRNAVIGKANRLGLYREQKARKEKSRPARSLAFVRSRKPASMPVLAEPLPQLLELPDPPQALTLMGLTSKTCRWPYGDGPFWFCGAPPLSAFPYCGDHCRKAYYRR